MTILITGGTGSFGSAFAEYLLNNTQNKIRILSRDEHKQELMARKFPAGERLTYILADVRDRNRLITAFAGVDAVVHAAALKTVPAGERHVDEFVQTNIDGTRNVIAAAIAADVSRVMFISSDKAVAAVNAYGKTKAVAECLITQANTLGHIRFASVRGGNVWMSNGSVGPLWKQLAANGLPLMVTDPKATRFHLEMPNWTRFVAQALEDMWGGEIFVPRAQAWQLGTLAEAFGTEVKITGRRPGDKQHEVLVGADEMARTVQENGRYVIDPPEALSQVWNYYRDPKAEYLKMEGGFTSYNAERLGRDELKRLVKGA